jgi:hypothetical protein
VVALEVLETASASIGDVRPVISSEVSRMRKMMSLSFVCGVLFLTATSRSDVAPPDIPLAATPIDEPITGAAITPAPGTTNSVPPKDPFAPYDVGPTNATWSYNDLSTAERALADRGRNTDGWTEVNAGFAAASAEQAQRAAAAAAASQLGVADLATAGVIP